MTKESVKEKSLEFAVRIVNACKYLTKNKKEYILSTQLLKSGTSIGANIAEAQRGQSTPDFASKMCIALKEAGEAEYWLLLLYRTQYFTEAEYKSLLADLQEIIRLLTSICKKVNPLS
ncbi:MAG: four helix bundle protein [Oscillospiraceae bacterium]|nr:four helix bundle protein [Oscillospiraceae bacterium]